MKTLTFAIQKGGAGKTTLAYNLAHALAISGKRVLAIDIDPQGSLSKGFLVPEKFTAFTRDCFESPATAAGPQKVRENVWLLAADRRLAAVERATQADVFFALQEITNQFKGEFDYCVIDTPPSLGILPTCAMVAADAVIVPLTPEPQTIDGMMQVHSTIANVRKRMNPGLRLLGHILNNVNWTRSLSRETQAQLREVLGENLFEAVIGMNVRIAEAWSHHKTIFEYDPEGKGAREFRIFSEELLRRLGDADEDRQDSVPIGYGSQVTPDEDAA